MSGGNYDISIDRGCDWTITLTWNDSDGNPYDLTGYSAEMMIRPAYSDQTSVTYATLSTAGDSPEIVLGGTAGTIQLSLTNEVTSTMPPGAAVYDLLLTNASGSVSKLLFGIAQVWDEVTT
jgi:hypothetical protein